MNEWIVLAERQAMGEARAFIAGRIREDDALMTGAS